MKKATKYEQPLQGKVVVSINRLFEGAARKVSQEINKKPKPHYVVELSEEAPFFGLDSAARKQVQSFSGFKAFNKACRKLDVQFSYDVVPGGDGSNLWNHFHVWVDADKKYKAPKP